MDTAEDVGAVMKLMAAPPTVTERRKKVSADEVFKTGRRLGSEPTRDRLCRPPRELEQVKNLTSDTGELNF
jgi:hypothetical protein